jgi:hypothetical protein
MGQISRHVTSVLLILVLHRSTFSLRNIRLIDFVTQLTAFLHAGSLVSCHNFLLCFNSRSSPEILLLMSENVTLMVASLYAEVIGAVKTRSALSASTSELISILGDFNSEARHLNRF